MDNEFLQNILMQNDDRRKLIRKMAASIVAAAAAYDKSEDEILNIMNLLVKAEIESHARENEIFKAEAKKMKKSLMESLNIPDNFDF